MDYKKLTYILLILSFIFPLLVLNGAVDVFAPIHVAQINEVRQIGHLTESEFFDFPEFYTFGIIIELIVGISSRGLIFFPIQLLPMIFLYFLLVYKLSNNYLLSSIFVFIELLAGTTGSQVFFWPHGIGRILYYTILFILLNINVKKKKLSEFTLLLVILGLSLSFISYDLYGMLLFILFTLFLLYSSLNLLLNKTTNKVNNEYSRLSTNIFNYWFLLIVIELGLSKLVYDSLIPLFKTTDYVEISAIDKFFLEYFSSSFTENLIGDMIINYPVILTKINIIKYSMLTISILICLKLIIKKILRLKNANFYDFFIISYIISSAIFGIMRLHIGQIPITLLYTPGIFCTIWLYNYAKIHRKWAIFVVILLLIMTPTSQYIYNSHNLVSRDQNMFEYINMPVYWCLEYGEPNIASDELTKNICKLTVSEYLEITPNSSNIYNTLSKKINLISPNEATFLVQRSNTISDKKYYLINYKLGILSLANWKIIKSWSYFKDEIDSNSKIKKIYDIGNIAIYY